MNDKGTVMPDPSFVCACVSLSTPGMSECSAPDTLLAWGHALALGVDSMGPLVPQDFLSSIHSRQVAEL